jgi:sigma-B regulation protein RsbU (phosphoserine phosphatase)
VSEDTPSQSPPLAPFGLLRVLVIDDDQVDRERVRRMLPKADVDATVLEEEDPTVALRTLPQLAPDVVLLDYDFPRHDGMSVLRDLRDLDAAIPVIVLTGHDETFLAVALMKAGAVDYIPKAALSPQRLSQSIRHAQRLRAAEFATRAAQEALRVSEEFNRRVLDSIVDCIKVLDLEGRLLSMSSAGQRALGVSDFAKVRGQSWLDLWPAEHREAAEAALAAARSGSMGQFVGRCPTLDGKPLWWDVRLTPMRGPDGRPERLLAVSRDISEQRKRAEFEQQLIGIVSHDLRNPVSAMLMGATILSQTLPADAPQLKVVSRIKNSGDKAARLIRDLLDFTQMRVGGGIPVHRTRSDVHEVVSHAVEELRQKHPDRALTHEASGDVVGLWDADRLSQVVSNLVHNALAYSPPDSPVVVSSQRIGDEATIAVHNAGDPIPESVIPTLFEPFKRGVRKHDPERSIGLGLFIVQELVKAHGGAVRVSTSARDGTTFTVTLPVEPTS